MALLFFILPLYRAPYLENSFITPKIALCHALVLVLLLVALWRVFRRGDRGTFSPVMISLGTFVCWNAASIIWAASSALAVFSTCYFVTLFLLHTCCVTLLRSRESVRAVLWAGIASAVITSIWTLTEDALRGKGSALVPLLPDWRGYLAAGLGNSGHIAGIIGLFLPALVVFLLVADKARVHILLLVVLFAALVVTWSLGSTGATVAALCTWALVAWRARNLSTELRWKRVSFVFAAGALVSAFYLLPHPLNPHQPSLWSEAFGSERWKEGGPTRLVIWKTTWHMIANNPLLGCGTGNFTYQYVQQTVPSLQSDPSLSSYAGGFTNDAHNEFLQVWSETGVAGLLLYLAVFAAFSLQWLRAWRAGTDKLLLIAAGAGVTVFLLDSLMSFPLRLPSHAAVLMFLLALPDALRASTSEDSGGGRGRYVLVVLLVLAVAVVPVYAKRIMAEYFMKQARTTAESDPVMVQGAMLPAWNAADAAFGAGAQLLAQGNKAGAEQAFTMMRQMAARDSLREAEKLFRKSLKWDARYSNASSRLGALLLMRGENTAAAEVLTQTLRDLESSEIHDRLGFANYFAHLEKPNPKLLTDARWHWEVARDRRPSQRSYFQGLITHTAP